MDKQGFTDLSPTRKAAAEFAGKLPDNRILGGETWHFFHLETEDYTCVGRTVQLACRLSGLNSPRLVSIDTFSGWLKREPENRGNGLDFDVLFDRDDIRDGVPIFVYTTFLDVRNDNNAKSASERNHYQLMMEFVQYCENTKLRQIEQIRNFEANGKSDGWTVQMQDSLYNQIFFLSYGSVCSLPDILKTSLCTISYPALTKQDFKTLLCEYHMRGEMYKSQRLLHQQENLKITDLKLSDDLLEWYANHMAGMQEMKVRRLLADMRNCFQGGYADYTKRKVVEPVIIKEKNNILKQHGRLEVIEVGERNFVQGLDAVENWLRNHKDVMDIPAASPTGILMVGIPGTGKSATAKMTAEMFGLPLVKLEMSRILGRYVGDSEKGMQEMLEDLKFAAPCVLWIDEIEKAMSGANGESGGNGVIQRLFGMLLTFMQENNRAVFTVTTANDISKLPPEFFRNGRFNQVFSVMMPDYEGCCAIMQQKLNRFMRELGWGKNFIPEEAEAIFDVCVGNCEKPRFLTGADIEAHVKELFWYYKRKGIIKCPEISDIVKEMKEIAQSVRVQASPGTPKSMEDIAGRYLDMMEMEMTPAGKEDTLYRKENLNQDAVRFYKFNEKKEEKGLPSCLKLPETKPYSEYEKRRSSSKPEEWYDAVFYYELVKEMNKIILYDKEHTLEQARNEYWELQQHLKNK